MPTVLLGSDHEVEGEVVVKAGGGWAVAISKGWESPAPKTDPNEDAVAVVPGAVTLATVADAHWGGASAWTVARVVARAEAGETDLAGLLRRASEHNRVTGERSECAALVVRVEGRQVRWVSIGDCRGYRVSAEGVEVLNRLQHNYLGADASWLPLDEGMRVLAAGDRLVLATDGVPECTYGDETFLPAEVAAVVRGAEIEEAARRLVHEALARGGEDNIAVAIVDVG